MEIGRIPNYSMKKILNIKDILGSEIRTRSLMENFSNTLEQSTEYLFNMEGVSFISRSAADELYNIVQEKEHVVIVNMTDFVQKMYDIVAIGRFKPRELKNVDVPVTYCQDMDSLSECLKAI